jgi:hypothetical protein
MGAGTLTVCEVLRIKLLKRILESHAQATGRAPHVCA